MQSPYYEKPPQKRTFTRKEKERDIMAENSRETELVLSPNEYALYLDMTKGNVNVVVGPYKHSLSQTDQLVQWDERSKRFVACNPREAKQKWLVIPEGWYAPLKNPAETKAHPQSGSISDQAVAGLLVGKKINIAGPDSFALWPGQMAKVIQGHRLHSNQYLLVRVYDVEAFKKEMKGWAGKPNDDEETTDEMKKARQADIYDGLDEEMLTTGQQFIIKGTDVHFYIPPNGVEVVPVQSAQASPDGKAQYVNNAVTLEQLQYCILADEDGNKRFIRGPAVVFPKPTERFVQTQGKSGTAAKKFRAIELNEISGLYIKVIKAYKDGDKSYEEGDEIFLTGKNQMIYFPREEHAIVRYEGRDKHHAVAIPAGEGRYVLDRMDGKIRMERGPSMFLADPRKEVIVRRILDDKAVKLMYPGNVEAQQHNAALRALAETEETNFIAENALSNAMLKGGPTYSSGRMLRRAAPAMEALYASTAEAVGRDLVGEEFARKNEYTPPRTVTLDTKYDGVVVVNVWTGYAVLVVDKQGNRRIVEGPETVLLEYDETLESMALSTGKPKNTDSLLETVYLRTKHNLVSDIVQVETSDLCKANVKLSYRVNFEGEGDDRFRWFDVENYVKYLTDHVRSMLKNAIKGISVREFYANAIEIVRDLVLSKKGEGGRPGLFFDENGMRIYDVEVLSVKLDNNQLEQKLNKRASDALDDAMELEDANRKLKKTQELETIKIANREAEEQTQRELARLAVDTTKVQIEADIQKLVEIAKRAEKQHEEAMAREADQLAQTGEELKRRKILFDTDVEQAKTKMSVRIEEMQANLKIEIERLQAEQAKAVAIGAAIDPDLTAALTALSDADLTEKLAAAVGPMTIFGEETLADLMKERFGNMGLERVLARVFNGHGREPVAQKAKRQQQPQK